MTIALCVKQLAKTYPNGTRALKGIDLEVKEGDFFALLGKNGAGKSTTIGIICSLINKTAGQVQVFGSDMDHDLAKAKSFIGVVPQELNFNAFETLSQILVYQAGYYGIKASIAKERMEFYLKQMGLWEMRDQPAIRLSGGMKRRLMIARAMMNEPRLLILDEPTAGVDIELRHLLWKFLTELNRKGTTIILTTHYLEEAEHLCKHVAIIDQGEIIEKDQMKSLLNRSHVQTIICDLKHPVYEKPAIPVYAHQFIDESTLEIEIKQNQSLNDLFQTLTQLNLEVTSMRNKTNRLEELFINLVHENKNNDSPF